MSALHILTYLSLIVFIIKIAERAWRIASTPAHLRWELYPVPHEKGRASYGGSRMEEVDWWTKEEKKDMMGEVKVMVPEIFLLKGVWEHNKELWLGSFPFHLGLYLLIANIFIILISSIVQLGGIEISSGGNVLGSILNFAVYFLELAGSIIGILGGIWLFFSRIIDPKLKNYSNPSHFFNIILITAVYVTSLLWVLKDPEFTSNVISYYIGLITISSIVRLPAIAWINILLCLVFLIYLPFTHMTHFFVKYFTYHHVRWEDTPPHPGSKMSRKISEQLNYPVSWAAPHIGADGRKTWVAIATEFPNQGKEN